MSLFRNLDTEVIDQSVASLFSVKDPVTKPDRSFGAQDKGDEDADLDAVDINQLLAVPEPVPVKLAQSQKSSGNSKRKRRHVSDDDENDDELEQKYMSKLILEESSRLPNSSKTEAAMQVSETEAHQHEETQIFSSDTSLVHESLLGEDSEVTKSKNTVFVGNLPTSVITSKSDYNTLKQHFAQYGVVESIRFRSIAFSELLPRKVAFLQQKLHDKRQTLNAYVVFSLPEAARAAATKSNSTVLLDRHLRVDSLAHPTKQDSAKSVFVGNLSFEAEEEQLWKHFAGAGDIESVRIVRDSKTNVGKGFAYIQFKDKMYVAQALLLNDKPIGGPKGRSLRVVRARNMGKTSKSSIGNPKGRHRTLSSSAGKSKLTPELKAELGRARKVMGKADRAKLAVLEGERATSNATVQLKKPKRKIRIRERSTAFKKNRKT
ncbi:uncharacterized protein V1516DRAFT_676683 [Lipomyces oligophaga]|uniref:uncharacterized protein n=1 Tax=Lipomyces oligophaga TaxID=45792 RepID=UPI0034CDCCA0